jgi:ferrous iron transport protein A
MVYLHYHIIYTIMRISINEIKEVHKMNKFLSDLLPGEKGVVKKVNGNSMIKRRIVDMGVVAGAIVEVQKFAPLGDPMEIKVKGFNLSLRKNEAELIELETA